MSLDSFQILKARLLLLVFNEIKYVILSSLTDDVQPVQKPQQ